MSQLQRRLAVVTAPDDAVSVTVAFASADRVHVDQHFGSARGFVMYRIGPESHHLVAACEFEAVASGHDDDKLRVRMSALDGCAAVYCLAVGPSAIRQLLALGVQPVRLAEPVAIAELLSDLQQELHDGPRGWLGRVLTHRRESKAGRFTGMADEGWQE